MELNEAIWVLAIGFMALIIFWLYGLTYLMFKNYKDKNVEGGGESTKAEDKEENIL